MPNQPNSTKKDSPEITPAPNKALETHIMEMRYQRAWEAEFAKLDVTEKNKVMQAKNDVAASLPFGFIRRVINLAESDERI
jgi:hypothetical protein